MRGTHSYRGADGQLMTVEVVDIPEAAKITGCSENVIRAAMYQMKLHGPVWIYPDPNDRTKRRQGVTIASLVAWRAKVDRRRMETAQ